jgi:hypothetical protein
MDRLEKGVKCVSTEAALLLAVLARDSEPTNRLDEAAAVFSETRVSVAALPAAPSQ